MAEYHFIVRNNHRNKEDLKGEADLFNLARFAFALWLKDSTHTYDYYIWLKPVRNIVLVNFGWISHICCCKDYQKP